MGTRPWVHIAIVLTVLFSIVQNGYAQIAAPGYTFEYWTQRDGLPSNGVSDVEPLGNGYVWLTTYDGLVRFNGIIQQDRELFTTFNKSNTRGFSTNRLISLDVLSDDEFFIKTERVGNSDNLIHYKNGVFKSYGEPEGIKNLVVSTSVDDNGSYWILNQGLLKRFSEGVWINEFPGISLPSTSSWIASSIKVVNDKNIWILTDSRLFNIRNGTMKEYRVDDGLSSGVIESIALTKAGNIWVGTQEGIHVIRNSEIQNIRLPENTRKKITGNIFSDRTSTERIIINLEGGERYIYFKGEFQLIPNDLTHPQTGQLRSFELIGSDENDSDWQHIGNKVFHGGKLAFQLPDDIGRYAVNTEGGFWFAKVNRVYRIRKATFNVYDSNNNGIENVYSLIKDSYDRLWGTGISGEIYWEKEKDKFSRFDEEYLIDDFRVYSVMEDSDRNMWFGLSDGVLLWNRESTPDTLFYSVGMQTRTMFEDSDGEFWVGGSKGVFKMGDDYKEWEQYPLEGSDTQPNIRLTYEDRNGVIWFGTNGNGLLYVDQETNTLKEFEHNHRLSDSIIRSIYQDEEGIFWVGTEGAGLNRMELKDALPLITHYDQRNGLFGGVIHSILEDKDARLWMSSNKGVFWVTRSDLNELAAGTKNAVTSIVYDDKDGLPGIEANGGVQSSGFADEKGQFWFPMIKGVAWVDPGSVQLSNDLLSTRIEKVTTSDTSYTYMGIGIELPKEQRNLQIDYVGYNYDVNPKNIRYRYKLLGYDVDWNSAESRTEAFYTSVPAGDYTFVIQTSVYGGDWKESPNTLNIVIAPYFHETIFFYFLCVLGVSWIGFLIYKGRVRSLKQRERQLTRKVDEQTHQLKEQAERLQELDKAKSRFFANISHEFRTPLTLTIGPLEDIKKSSELGMSERIRKKANLALRNSKRLLRLVDQILDISKIETGHLAARVSEQDLVGFIQPIGQAFLGLAEKKQIQYNIKLPQRVLPFWFDADMMEKIVGNLLSNAFKFTQKQGTITLEVTETEGEQILIAVTDSGVGIPKEELEHVFERFYQAGESVSTIQAGTGIGLSLVKELVDLHHGEIKVESDIMKGTTFTVLLKKGSTHFEEDQIEKASGSERVLEAIDLSFIEDLGNEVSFETKPVDEESPGVLLIDDNEEIREYIKEFIGIKYRVFEAENGEQGLELARTELPDVIICDVMMPVMDGYDFVRELRSAEETDFIPVMLLTAKAEQSDKLEGLGLGANDYIVKPFDIEEVQLKTDNLIKSQKKIKARFSASSFNLNIEAESVDEQFLKEALKVIEENIDTEDFGVVQFAEAMLVSRAALYARMKEIVGRTPSEFIWDVRLEYAAELLKQNAGNITEIAYSSGFKSVAHFSRSFKKKFDTTPRVYLKEKSN